MMDGVPQTWASVKPVILRIFIIYDYQFVHEFNKFLQSPSGENMFVMSAPTIFQLAYKFPDDEDKELAISLLPNYFRKLSDLTESPDSFTKNIIVKQLANSIFACCDTLFVSLERITPIYTNPIILFFNYFSSHCITFGTDDVPPGEICVFHNKFSFLRKIQIDVYQNNFKLFDPLIDSIRRFLEIISKYKLDKPDLYDPAFIIGDQMLLIFSSLTQLDGYFRDVITRETNKINFSIFILWMLDHFPLNELSLNDASNNPNDDILPMPILSQLNIPSILPNYKFIEKPTFNERIKTIYQFNEENAHITENHINLLEDNIPLIINEPVSKLIESNRALKKLLTDFLLLFRSIGEDLYLSQFLLESFTILDKLLAKDPEMCEVFNVDGHILAFQFEFFIINILSHLQNTFLVAKTIPLVLNGWKVLFNQSLFTQSVNTWVKSNPYFEFCFMIRKYVQHFAWVCFSLGKDVDLKIENEIMMTSIVNVFNESYPQIFDEMIPFFTSLYLTSNGTFIEASRESGVIEMFFSHIIHLQAIHIYVNQEDKYESVRSHIAQGRINLFIFLDKLLKADKGKVHFFSNSIYIRYVFHFLFEEPVQFFASDLLKRGLMLNSYSLSEELGTNQINLICKAMSEFFSHAIEDASDKRWLELLIIFLKFLKEGIEINRNTIFQYFKTQQIMVKLAKLVEAIIHAHPEDFKDDGEITLGVKTIGAIFDLFFPLYRENAAIAKTIQEDDNVFPLISESLSKITFDSYLIDKLLTLVFEQPINLDSLPKTAQIRNYYALPFLFYSTKHLPLLSVIIKFLSAVCNDSISNKLRVYQAHLPDIILDFVQQFPSQDAILPATNNAIGQSLQLFSIVSQYVFSVTSLFHCIQVMRPKENMRVWWTTQIVSLFQTFIEAADKPSPSAFFYLDGRHTGFDLPIIPLSYISKGWTFICRFELDLFRSANSTFPILLNMYTFGGESFEISLNKSVLQFSFKSPIQSRNWEEKIEEVEFDPNVWYSLVFTSEGTLVINQFPPLKLDKPKILFKDQISAISVGNVPTKITSLSEAPLAANISAIYMFSGCITNEQAKQITNLPLDFVFGFSPSEYRLDKRLTPSLFNGDLQSKLLVGINARLTDGNVCYNLSTTPNIGNGTFRGIAYPFSTSFVDITNYVGGVKLFLPLFSQANLPIYDNEKQTIRDGSHFMMQLIYMFQYFFSRSYSMEYDFIRQDGFKAIAYSFIKSKPEIFIRTVLISLSSLYLGLTDDEHKSILMSDIFTNFLIWKRMPQESQYYLYNNLFIELFQHDPILFRKHIDIGEFLAIIAEQPVEELRKPLWNLLMECVKISFTKEDQDSLFSFTLLTGNLSFQLEAFQCLYDVTSQKIHHCHHVFQRKRECIPFITHLKSPFEQIRLFGIKFIILIGSLPEFKGDLDLTITQNVRQLNLENTTNATWDLLMNYSFDKDFHILPTLRYLFPFVCYVSYVFEQEQILSYINNITVALDDNKASYVYITNCPFWYFWLLYLLFQLHRPFFKFDSHDQGVLMISSLLASLAVNEGSIEPIFFYQSLEYVFQWNVVPLIHSILDLVLQIISDCSVNTSTNMIIETITFLDFIQTRESYSKNVQLLFLHENIIKDDLQTSIPGHITFKEYLDIFDDYIQDLSPQFSFSLRVTENGLWIDEAVALSFFVFFKRNSNHPQQLSKLQKIKVNDLYAFTAYQVLLMNPTSSVRILGYIHDYLSRTQQFDSSSCKILLSGMARASLKNIEMVQVFNGFIQKEPILSSYVKSISPAASFSDPNFAYTIITEYGEDINNWIDQFQTLTSVASDIWKQRYIIMCQTIKIALERIKHIHVNFDYTFEMDMKTRSMKQKQRKDRSLAAKAYRRITRSLIFTGGHWDSDTPLHWKLTQRIDAHFRHIYLRPNRNFDIHKGASLRRDQSKNETAKLEYQRWIETQNDDPVSSSSIDLFNEAPTRESQIAVEAKMITIETIFDGTFYLTDSDIIFDGIQATNEILFSMENKASKTIQMKLKDIIWVLHRSYLHIDRGLEFFTRFGQSHFFYFHSISERTKILRQIASIKPPNLEILQRTSSMKFFSDNKAKFTDLWLNHQMSTYDYLMVMNMFAGRSFNDLSQYPVFPWVIADYTSEKLDLEDPKTFRDLSKPIGALNPKRIEKLLNDYNELDDHPSKCLYRCHYSTAYYVLLYMIRLEPFTTMHITMQEDKFDHANRIFSSIPATYASLVSMSNDYRELIPEFYSLSDIFVNTNGFDLGLEGNGDVILPPWADNAVDFVAKHREALESDYVGKHIGQWIDLIFGYKQSGNEALEANNLFHHYCYSSCVTPDVLQDHDLLCEIQNHAGSFGIIPRRLFVAPHPNRPSKNKLTDSKLEIINSYQEIQDILMLISYESSIYYVTSDNNLVCLRDRNHLSNMELYSSIQIPFDVAAGQMMTIIPKANILVVGSPANDSFHAFKIEYNIVPSFSVRQQYSALISLASVGSILATLSQDGSLSLWEFNDNTRPDTPSYRVNHHLVSAVDLAINENLRLVVSCDISRRVVITDLRTGSFIRSFTLCTENIQPNHIMLLESGYIATLFIQKNIDDAISKIQVNGINSEFISSYERNGEIVTWSPLNQIDGKSFIVMSFNDGFFAILSVPYGKIVYEATFQSVCTNISYNQKLDCLFISNNQNQVYSLEFNC